LASAGLSVAAAVLWALLVVSPALLPKTVMAVVLTLIPGLYAAALLYLLDRRAAIGMIAYAAASAAVVALAPHWVRVVTVSTLHIVAGMVILIAPFMASYSDHLKACSAGAASAGFAGILMLSKSIGLLPASMKHLAEMLAGYGFAFAALLIPVGLLLASRVEPATGEAAGAEEAKTPAGGGEAGAPGEAGGGSWGA